MNCTHGIDPTTSRCAECTIIELTEKLKTAHATEDFLYQTNARLQKENNDLREDNLFLRELLEDVEVH